MDKLVLTKRELKKLPELQLPSKVISTEAKLYLMTTKTNWIKNKNVLKIFYRSDSPKYMKDKLYVIQELIKYKDIIQKECDNLILPDLLIYIDNVLKGYSMNYIESSINLSILLNNPNIKLKEKIKYLKGIYNILEKINNIYELKNNFYLNDIHESNFIFDVEDQKIKAVDMDSCYINGSIPQVNKFFCMNHEMENFPNKYKYDEETNLFKPSRNTTLISFIFILLNTLSNDRSYEWELDYFYSYLEYLNSRGVNYKLTDELKTIYTNSNSIDFNIENLNYLDSNLIDYDVTKDNYRI